MLFTKENAAIHAAKARLKRKENAERLAKAAEAFDLMRSEQREKIAKAEAIAEASPERVQRVLQRTTASVDGLFGRLQEEISMDELDAGKVDKLTSAVARMAELERVLSMRPAPAPLRSKPTKSRSDSATPLEPITEPVH